LGQQRYGFFQFDGNIFKNSITVSSAHNPFSIEGCFFSSGFSFFDKLKGTIFAKLFQST